ncbi:TATA box-binding protein-associated factor RNA polymerase I subunit C [Stegastes partitus]|uniref:TATA box-binding protein-associated factor RNA polymerase I subunit C n=2 Tax=Stegastes partitus TaxID=144197 RepID=A0A9Y4KKL2_9TELE|nr:PREDICTED: TATA box-binding protein-associated factor RNA polymerase I subunit C [Stegastes partitus]
MDYKFPEQLFPSFYNLGPPDSVSGFYAGSWGSYDRVRPQGGSGRLSSWTLTAKHQPRGESWRHTEPAPVPLLSPRKDLENQRTALTSASVGFVHIQMENFFLDHCYDAFGCMSDLLGEKFDFSGNKKTHRRSDSVQMGHVKRFLHRMNFKICQQSYESVKMKRYSLLMPDVVHVVPPQLLGSLLHEELTDRRDGLLFPEGTTGGALAFVPFSPQSDARRGCLVYPGHQGLDRLHFHKVALQHRRGSSSSVDADGSPFSFQLKGSIRQISCSSLSPECCVGVRSDYFCGVWKFSERNEPRLLQVVETSEVATCINVSPHILGEVLVASESGAVKLWTVGKGMQAVRTEDANLYFNAKSPWRWCEFSAHPRVMLYADRTGVELTDVRTNPASSHTLFRISSAAECRSGERLVLSRYLGDAHSFHHLVTTQYSAYIMDERFPGVPMLKWDHMMESPPMSCHVVPGSSPSGSGEERTTKVLLGSHFSQEITMLQYSGGRAEACSSRGPPQALLRPRESLKHLPVQIPHRLDTATNRLSSPAAGLTCIQKKSGGDECLCVLQLTAAGDIFYQILEPEQPDAETSRPPAAEDEPQHQQAASAEQLPPELVVADTSSDEDVIGPTQCVQRVVPETPERSPMLSMDSEDSELESKSRYLKRLALQVVVNNEPELDRGSDLEASVKESGNVAEDVAEDAEEPNRVEGTVNGSSRAVPPRRRSPVKLSSSSLVTWKHWLQKLMHVSCDRKSHSQHFQVQTEGLLQLSNRQASEKEHVQSLREDLKSCMSRRSLLVDGVASAPLRAPDVVPLPNQVDEEAWTDRLSRRLTVSWQGEEAWRSWWKEELGMNREEKMQALRRKRRKEKEAKRAAGGRLKLTGSFTSSVSYQSALDDLSDLSGWSSATSQMGWSDREGRRMSSQVDDFWENATPSTAQNAALTPTPTVTPTATPTTTPQKAKDGRGDQQTPSRPPTFSSSQKQTSYPTPTGPRRNKRSADEYLNSLFASQV